MNDSVFIVVIYNNNNNSNNNNNHFKKIGDLVTVHSPCEQQNTFVPELVYVSQWSNC